MQVWVIMGNDFPDTVFNNEIAANKYIEKRQIEEKARNRKEGPRVYWRAYEFKLKEK